jgi:hypothetical protein
MSTVYECGFRQEHDINFEGQKSASKWESLAAVCVSRSRDALKQPTGTYSKIHRDTISDLLKAMLVTQGSIGKLLNDGSRNPQSVDALGLARLQVEGLFAICLLTEGSAWADAFLRDGWKKQFIRYLLFKYETECLPRFGPNAHVPELSRLVKFRDVCSVSLAQMHTLELQQIKMPMPAGMALQKIPDFPTPGGVIRELPLGSKRRMLERLHMDYVYLCSFAHGLQAANMAKSVYDDRSLERKLFAEAWVEQNFQQDVNTYARSYSILSIAQAAAELMVLYPNNMDLVAAVADAWHDLIESTFFVNAVWNLRTKELLGVVYASIR